MDYKKLERYVDIGFKAYFVVVGILAVSIGLSLR